MDLIKKASKLGYKHYTGFTITELDKLNLKDFNKQIEYYFIQKWLREKHDIFVISNRIHCDISDIYPNGWQYFPVINSKIPFKRYSTYEEALEEGLYECLKLIELCIIK